MPTKRRGPQSQHLSTTGVIGEIDRRLTELDLELESTRPLIDERRRLLRARATLSGDPSSPAGNLVRKVTQDEVADYLTRRPGSRAGAIAQELGVPLTNISQHLHRAKATRFERREDGWYIRKRTRK